MPSKFVTALGNLELKRKQNAEKKKEEASKKLKAATNNKHPKAMTKGGGKTCKSRKGRKTRKGRK